MSAEGGAQRMDPAQRDERMGRRLVAVDVGVEVRDSTLEACIDIWIIQIRTS